MLEPLDHMVMIGLMDHLSKDYCSWKCMDWLERSKDVLVWAEGIEWLLVGDYVVDTAWLLALGLKQVRDLRRVDSNKFVQNLRFDCITLTESCRRNILWINWNEIAPGWCCGLCINSIMRLTDRCKFRRLNSRVRCLPVGTLLHLLCRLLFATTILTRL